MGKIRPFFVRLRFSMQMALHGVVANPMRSLLTVLGVTIGVAAVVSLMGIGEGARNAVMQQFESLGSNVIMIKSTDGSDTFNPSLSESLVERVDPLIAMTPVCTAKTDMRWRRATVETNILGVNADFPIVRDHQVADGTFFSDLQVDNSSRVTVLGANVAQKLTSGRSPVGQTVSLGGYEYRIIGVMEPKGANQADGVDDMLIIPYTTAQKYTQSRLVPELWGKSTSSAESNLAMVQISRIFKNQTSYDAEKITITNMDEMIKEADKANQIMTLLLGGIAAVSLLVGGLGIMNIMLVAVSERTGEIGVRRALGARRSDLVIQFMLESLYLSIAGAIIGVLIGILAMGLFENYGFSTAISTTAIRVAVSVAIGCGLIFGVYPALNASTVPPVEALRRD